MYACEKTLPPHESLYFGLLNSSHLNMFHVNIIPKNSPKKALEFFLGTLTINGPTRIKDIKEGWWGMITTIRNLFFKKFNFVFN
jgi:hypothetical protein